jgi:hypothetical protein
MNEQREKKEWTSPEIIDLDVMETAGKLSDVETGTFLDGAHVS